MINTIIFDMGNVLIDFRWKALYHEMGLEGEKFDKMARATVLDPVWNEFDRGEWTDEEILEGFIRNAPDIEKELRDFYGDRFRGLLRKYDYTDEWLDRLKAKGYRIYILSNFSRKAYRECADELDYIKKADGAVISYMIKMIKPDPEIYRYLLDTYDIKPEEAVFIDDTEKNLAAARDFGINTILFTGKEDADRALAGYGVVY
ncbi:MAG: HAD family phosphatase [Lachnospiraceae bacterium]|nr:HAD family phosphatase [Lachnospiraceae bacterium]